MIIKSKTIINSDSYPIYPGPLPGYVEPIEPIEPIQPIEPLPGIYPADPIY